jgi:hypothetical protein
MSGGTLYASNGKEQFTNDNPAIVQLKTGSIQTTPSGKQDVKVVDPLPQGANVIGGTTLTGASGAQGVISTGANSNDGNGGSNNLLYTAGYNLLFNGTAWDRQRSNIEGVLMSSIARTATVSSGLQFNHNARSLFLFLNVTVASATGGLIVILRGRDPVSGQMADIKTFATVNAVGKYVFHISPELSATPLVIPRQFDVYISHVDSSSYTYSLGYSLLV